MSSVGVLLQQEPLAFYPALLERGWLSDDHNAVVAVESWNGVLTSIDIRALLIDLDLLLTRLIQSAVNGHSGAFQGYSRLFVELLSCSEKEVTQKLFNAPELMKGLRTATLESLVQRRVSLRASAEWLNALAFLADTAVEGGKDRFGSLLMLDLCTALQRLIPAPDPNLDEGPQQAAEGLWCRRSLLTVLVNLMKKSKANKDTFFDHVGLVGAMLLRSSDFLLQMQCVELLYRMFKHRRPALAAASLPADLNAGIERLPNDRGLLKEITELLKRHNSEARRDILAFTVASVVAGGASLCSTYSTIFFSPHAMIVLLPDLSGENLTVPYSDIRSVKLNKTRSITFTLRRVNESALALVRMMRSSSEPAASAEDLASVVVQFTPTSLEELRGSPVLQWITLQKQLLSETAMAPDVPASRDRRDEPPRKSPGKRLRAEDGDAPLDASAFMPKPRSAKSAVIAERNPNRDAQGHVTSEKHRSLGQPAGRGAAEALTDDEMMEQLRSAIRGKVSKARMDSSVMLRDTMQEIQLEIDQVRQCNRRRRDAVELAFRAEMEELQREEGELRAKLSTAVNELNTGLSELQSVAGVVQQAIDGLEEGEVGAAGLQTEERELVALKARVEAEMASMEEVLNTFISSANPLRFLTAYVNRKAEEGV